MITCAHHTTDAAFAGPEGRVERGGFAEVRLAERLYGRHLRWVAGQVGAILRAFDPTSDESMRQYQAVLEDWARALTPWARSRAQSMLVDVQRRDLLAWRRHTEAMGRGIRLEIQQAPTGHVMRALQEEQVHLITSLPLEAAQRVHRLTQEGLSRGMRPAELAREILATGHVTKSRADLIARTEVGRAASSLMQARAQAVGSEGYIWRKTPDRHVRPSHAGMSGRFVRWDDPPVLDGLRGHAGGLPNCRCRAEPVLPD